VEIARIAIRDESLRYGGRDSTLLQVTIMYDVVLLIV